MTNICISCLKDPFLREHLAGKVSAKSPCDYCYDALPGVPLFDIAAECDRVIDEHFESTHDANAVVLYGRDPVGANLDDTLVGLQVVPDDALEELNACLQSLWFDRDTGESKHGDDEPFFTPKADMSEPVSSTWKGMEASLREEARYLNPDAQRVLDEVLGSVADDCTAEGDPVIVPAGPGTAFSSLYRARVFQTDAALEEALKDPERLLGTPAAGIGMAGRMNAKGQPAFYGATERGTAIAEVRPPVGSRVAVAAFDVLRPLRLLDLRSLARVQRDAALSLFDPRSVANAQRRDFLRVLSRLMVAPVMPDLQDRDYLITQVIADYLATHPRADVDGILYPSTQSSGHGGNIAGENVVLFPRASRVRQWGGGYLSRSASLWEMEEDGPGHRYQPQIWIQEPPPGETDRSSSPYGWSTQERATRRQVALGLVQNQIDVHEVRGVAFETTCDRVTVHLAPVSDR
ncbi:RES family NAD+ phosphorylase [Variovorax sp. LjRoot290]|uniref:RES family NAD+ phosphorylase n=1 Tax=Variovorax sp. LjRoot290 TaxID=3342316 RepID=UPI003ECC5E3C